jgi:hypothetical protein
MRLPLLRFTVRWRFALFGGLGCMLCMAASCLAQSYSGRAINPDDSTVRLYFYDDRPPPVLYLDEGEIAGGLGEMGLPDSPLPQPWLDTNSVALPPSSTTAPRKEAPAQAAAPAASPGGTSLAQQNADFGQFSINGMDVAAVWSGVQRAIPPGVDLGAREVPIVDPTVPNDGIHEGYHWSGLLAQSLLFNVTENTFRAASDDQIRHMLANKPFWHDWVASTKQFNMRRWNDGDDFLVNYIGHPLQGSTSGFIEIQNDPVGRQLEMSADREYWKSRFKAFLWAAAYSTHSEISPVGEAGIGNEGGWTYPIKCKEKGCPSWNPKTMHSTNNTGWVDFVITPTVGTLWLLAEDALDRFVSDRVQGSDRASLGPAFLRGALNPARTMANFMRFQAPWYRDFQHDPGIESSFITRVQPSDEQLAELGPRRRFSIAPYFQVMPFGNPAHPCIVCVASPGVGIGVDIALNQWLSASFAVQRQAGLLAKGSSANGSTVSVGYGVRFVHEGLGSTLSVVVRSGIVTEEIEQPERLDLARNTYVSPTQNVVHNAFTIMVSEEFKVTRTIAVRYSAGDTIVRYQDGEKDPPGIGTVPYLSWLSKDNYTNKSNWSAETGPVVRF